MGKMPGSWYADGETIRDHATDGVVARADDGSSLVEGVEIFNEADRVRHARIVAAAPDMLAALVALRTMAAVPIAQAGKPSVRLSEIFPDDFAAVNSALAKAGA